MANQRRRRRDLGRSSITEDRPRPMNPRTQGQTVSDDVIRGRASSCTGSAAANMDMIGTTGFGQSTSCAMNGKASN